MNNKLSRLQAFNAMDHFLDQYYLRTLSDDIGTLLGGMSFLADGRTADSAAWVDWMDALGNDSPEILTVLQAYDAMIRYLDEYAKRISSDEVHKLVHNWSQKNGDKITDHAIWSVWLECIHKIMKQDDSRRYLQIQR